MNELLIGLIGIAIGSAITWFVSWFYYRRAGRELRDEADELRRLNGLMLHGMEHAGWIKLNRDASGKISVLSKPSIAVALKVQKKSEIRPEYGPPKTCLKGVSP